jgi:4-amino-4-deoxy-L-arabinose transferase-like glycosyltransferase
VWIVAVVLFRTAALAYPPAGQQFLDNVYPISTTLGLLLAVWAGASVKMAKGTHLEAVLAGIVVGVAFAVPGVIIFGLQFIGPAINVTIFSLAPAWVGWGLKA